MKLKYIVYDISKLLVEYYIDILNLKNIKDSQKNKMILHMKQAISDTYSYMYDPIDDIHSIGVWDHGNIITYELNTDCDYDSITMNNIINGIQNQFNQIISTHPIDFSYDSDLISFNCVPFDGFSITTREIISLLDIDYM